MVRNLGILAFAALMALVVMSATAETAHADNCANGYVSGDFNLCYGWSASGDVRMDGNILYDSGAGSEGTGSVVTCWRQPFCNGFAQWGASVSSDNSATLVAALYDHGCGSRCSYVRPVSCPSADCPNLTNQPAQPAPQPAVTYTRMYFAPGAPVMGGWIYINGSYVGYSCYVPSAWGSGYVDGGSVNPQFTPGASVTLCTGGTTVPVPAVNQPVYPPVYPSGTSTGWGGSITIGASGTNSWIVISSSGQTFTNCWFPATPPGGGSAQNAVPNVVTVSNPPPTNLPLCGPVITSNGLMEIRTADWYPGQWVKIQGIAIATNDGKRCNNGNCVVDQTTAASTGGRVWYLAPAGSPQGSVSPFTPAYAVSQPPAIVFPNTTEIVLR